MCGFWFSTHALLMCFSTHALLMCFSTHALCIFRIVVVPYNRYRRQIHRLCLLLIKKLIFFFTTFFNSIFVFFIFSGMWPNDTCKPNYFISLVSTKYALKWNVKILQCFSMILEFIRLNSVTVYGRLRPP